MMPWLLVFLVLLLLLLLPVVIATPTTYDLRGQKEKRIAFNKMHKVFVE